MLNYCNQVSVDSHGTSMRGLKSSENSSKYTLIYVVVELYNAFSNAFQFTDKNLEPL